MLAQQLPRQFGQPGTAPGGGIDDLIAGLRQQTGRAGISDALAGGMPRRPGGASPMGIGVPARDQDGGGVMRALPMPEVSDPLRQNNGRPPGGGFNATPFKPAPAAPPQVTTLPAPAPGPLPGDPGAGAPAPPASGGGVSSSPASVAPRPAARPGYQTQTLPAPVGGTDAAFAELAEDMPGTESKTPGWQDAGFRSRQHAENQLRKSGEGGTLKNFIQGKIAGGEGEETPQPEIMTKPAAPGPKSSSASAGPPGAPPARIGGALVKPAAPGSREGIATPGVQSVTGSGYQAKPFAPEPAPGGGMKPFIPPGLQSGPAPPASATPRPAPAPPRPQAIPGSREGIATPRPQAIPLPAKPPSQIKQQFDGDRAAAEAAMKAAGGTGTLKNWLAGQAGAGGAAGGLSPEQSWAMENMPGWAKEQGADSGAVLNFIKKNPGSPLAQKFQAAGLAG